MSYARLTVTKDFGGDEADRELVRQVRAFQFPLERIHCGVIEHPQQPMQAGGKNQARSRDTLGLVRGAWMCHLMALGLPVYMVKARTWQEWCGVGGRTKRKDRLAALPGLARTATRTTDEFHHDVAAAILVGTYWLRNGGLGGQTT